MATKIIQSKTYYTPFPREKSNNEVLKNSYSRKLSKNSTLINIPPSVTVSYMKKNPFYFDLKKKKKIKDQNPLIEKQDILYMKIKNYKIY